MAKENDAADFLFDGDEATKETDHYGWSSRKQYTIEWIQNLREMEAESNGREE